MAYQTMTNKGISMFTEAVLSRRLVFVGAAVRSTELSENEAKNLDSFIESDWDAGSLDLSGLEVLDKQINVTITFQAQQTAIEGKVVALFARFENEEGQLNYHAISVAGTTSGETSLITIPSEGGVFDSISITFEIAHSISQNVVILESQANYVTQEQFRKGISRFVSAHSVASETIGEDQNIYGAKTFENSLFADRFFTEDIKASRSNGHINIFSGRTAPSGSSFIRLYPESGSNPENSRMQIGFSTGDGTGGISMAPYFDSEREYFSIYPMNSDHDGILGFPRAWEIWVKSFFIDVSAKKITDIDIENNGNPNTRGLSIEAYSRNSDGSKTDIKNSISLGGEFGNLELFSTDESNTNYSSALLTPDSIEINMQDNMTNDFCVKMAIMNNEYLEIAPKEDYQVINLGSKFKCFNNSFIHNMTALPERATPEPESATITSKEVRVTKGTKLNGRSVKSDAFIDSTSLNVVNNTTGNNKTVTISSEQMTFEVEGSPISGWYANQEGKTVLRVDKVNAVIPTMNAGESDPDFGAIVPIFIPIRSASAPDNYAPGKEILTPHLGLLDGDGNALQGLQFYGKYKVILGALGSTSPGKAVIGLAIRIG